MGARAIPEILESDEGKGGARRGEKESFSAESVRDTRRETLTGRQPCRHDSRKRAWQQPRYTLATPLHPNSSIPPDLLYSSPPSSPLLFSISWLLFFFSCIPRRNGIKGDNELRQGAECLTFSDLFWSGVRFGSFARIGFGYDSELRAGFGYYSEVRIVVASLVLLFFRQCLRARRKRAMLA
ncbi:hypothetical protein B0H11DRAFT_2239251 [Mycena galericulata]|nr:hypothetical protein B0H11DRAFT_2239251 [Mycena galericulata]